MQPKKNHMQDPKQSGYLLRQKIRLTRKRILFGQIRRGLRDDHNPDL